MVVTRLRAKFRHCMTRRLWGDRPQTKLTNSQLFSRFNAENRSITLNLTVLLIRCADDILDKRHKATEIWFSTEYVDVRWTYCYNIVILHSWLCALLKQRVTKFRLLGIYTVVSFVDVSLCNCGKCFRVKRIHWTQSLIAITDKKNHFNALPSSQAQSQKNMSAAPATFVHKLRKAQSGVAPSHSCGRDFRIELEMGETN